MLQMNINLAKSIVIMDEAHNIEDTCREAGSLWLKQNELEEAIMECDENVASGRNTKEYAKIVIRVLPLYYHPCNKTFKEI